MCYLVTIPEFGEAVTFHIVKKNFKVNVDPKTVFQSEVTAAVANPPPPPRGGGGGRIWPIQWEWQGRVKPRMSTKSLSQLPNFWTS